MGRAAILALVICLLLAATFLVYFLTSDLNRPGQSIFVSLSDFVFLARSSMRVGLDRPLPLDDDHYEHVMSRFRPTTYWEVKSLAVHELESWGEEVVPRLVAEIGVDADPSREAGALRGLAAIKDPRAVDPIGRRLVQSLEQADGLRSTQRELIDALGEHAHPSAAAFLLSFLRRGGPAARHFRQDLHDALGRTRNAADYLLAELARSDDSDHIHSLLWALAHTRDARVAEVLAELLKHPVYAVRQRARDAMDQSMGPVAIDPAIDVLLEVEDDYVRGAILDMILDDGDARDNPRAVPAIARFVGHPVLDDLARYALARIGTEQAIAVLEKDALGRSPSRIFEALEPLGSRGLGIVAGLLEHESPWVRRLAIDKLARMRARESAALIGPLIDDPDAEVRAEARAALFRLDRINLLWTYSQTLPEQMGRAAWNAMRSRPERGFRSLLEVLTVLHWVGIGLSLLIGIWLVLGRWRIFEPFRFNLFVQFLLVEGFVGDLLFLGNEADPERVYLYTTGVHLFLLMGFLLAERDRLPDELRSRFERLGGASLWILVPGVLYAGTPPLAGGLRLILSDYALMRPVLVLLLVLSALVLEQWVLPWDLLARSARVARLLSGVLSAATLAIPVAALVHASGDPSGSVRAGIDVTPVLIAALIWMLILHLGSIDLFRRATYSHRRVSAPTRRLRAVMDGDRLTVRVHPEVTAKAAVMSFSFKVIFGFTAGAVAGFVAGSQGGDAPAMVLALIIAFLGAAVAGLLLELASRRLIVQIRQGYARAAATVLGGTSIGGRWSRRLMLSTSMRQAISGSAECKGSPFSDDEQQWLMDALAGEASAGPAAASGSRLGLKVVRQTPMPDGRSTAVRVRVENRGGSAFRPADLDSSGVVGWQAEVGGRAVDLYLSAGDRRQRIEPGRAAEIEARVYSSADLAGSDLRQARITAGRASTAVFELLRPVRS